MYAGLGLRHQVAQRKLEEDRRITEEAEMRLANARKVAVRSKVSHHELLEHLSCHDVVRHAFVGE